MIHLGFVEEFESTEIVIPEDIPHKVGGNPMFLYPANHLQRNLKCEKCAAEMALLVQLYTPIYSKSIIRFIYVWACKSACKSFLCSRSQVLEKDFKLFEYDLVNKFKEWEIVTELEPEDLELPVRDDVVEVTQEPDDDQDFEDTRVLDEAFLKFQKRIERDSSQILRISGLDEDAGPNDEILWVAEQGRVDESNVPPCENCKSPRVFEFQVLPQLLSFLHEDGFDFGNLVVFTCKNNCQRVTSNEDYQPEIREYIHHQEFSDDCLIPGFRTNKP